MGVYRRSFLVGCLAGFFALASTAFAQHSELEGALALYQNLRRFDLSGGSAVAERVILKRDRVEISFDGTFYFEAPINGRVCGAVFLGRGNLRAEVPPSSFELANVRRLLKADLVESDFQTAVLRFSDDTFDSFAKNVSSATEPPPQALKLASEFEPRLLRESGANVSARLAVSLLNGERPGFFLAQFDKGRRGRFTFLLDYQTRIPAAGFGIDAGERGLIFAHRSELYDSEVWTAFHSLQDYERGRGEYPFLFDQVETPKYVIQTDVRNPKKVLKITVQMNFESLVDDLRAVSLTINENLSERDSMRLKKALRLKASRLAEGTPVDAVQEDWESGLTLLLPSPLARGQKFAVVMEFEGDFMYDSEYIPDCYYPLSSSGWYPRHGSLRRSVFDLTFRHRKEHRVYSAGSPVREEAAPDNDSERITEWKMDAPVTLLTFGVGRFERHAETVRRKEGDLPIEFYSMPGSIMAIKEDFMLAELINSVQFFSALFGPYPYAKFGAVFHPRPFGQGLPSMLLLPRSDSAEKHTYAFIAHETAHQWWGDIVAWRSYRDQWLSEGFAEYSGILYTARRDKRGSHKELIRELRDSLKAPPRTETGIGKGRLADVGPIVLGHRLSTRETFGAYQALIYNKGALVLRMLHFLLTDPTTGEGQAFFDTMSDFVRRHKDGWASTEDFRAVANEHFARTPLARQVHLQDLDWFFRQWVYEAYLPSYRMEYSIANQPDGTAVVKGTVYQENALDGWFMPLPVVLHFGKERIAYGTVFALGPHTPFNWKMRQAPTKIELDPDNWVLSEKTTTKSLD